ncbi:hypothetical protein ACPOLB_13185 [Rubrivivax sp. RP6-9]|uniref:hypothetical protein n=1 Tax=Rubrivivax sp. RP6-9 TaxID=3415750 RepID=UPI003CC60A7A
MAARVGAVALVAVLAACGGGGGGGGGSDFRVTLDRSSLRFDMTQGIRPETQQITATATGTLPSTLFVGAVVEGQGIDPVIPTGISGNQAVFNFLPRLDLTPGTYTGRVLLSACSDSACNNKIGGTPIAVGYTVVVVASLQVAPQRVDQFVVGGTGTSARVQVQLPTGASTVTARVTNPAPWLEIGTFAAGEVPLSFKPWRAGTYSTTLELTSGSETALVPVSYSVDLPPGGETDFAASADNLTFATSENASSAVQTLALTPPSWAPGSVLPTVTVDYGGGPTGWLQVTPRSSAVDVQANAATAALPQGSYTAALVLTPPQPATPLRIPVALTVGPGLVAPAPRDVVLTAETAATALQGSIPVDAAGGAPQTWTATSSEPWLQLTQASGSTGQNLAWRVDAAAVAAMANFSDATATITIRSGLAHVSPVTSSVRIDKRLPEVQHLGPYLVVSGRTTTLQVRGRGFDGIANLGARLQAAGIGAGTATRVSDTELRLDVAPAAAGSARIITTNALGEALGGATLQVVAPQTFAYAAVPTGGIKRAVVYDAQRRSVYAVNVENEALNRFRFDGSSWVLDATSVPAILDAGLSPDGSALLVSATPGTLRLLDPATLATTFTLAVPDGLARNLTYVGHGISTTSDGRSWLPLGSTGWNELGYFDHATRTLQPRPSQPGLSTSFYGGPWTMMPRDGSRMLVVQSGSISPSPPALVYDTSSGLLADNGVGLTFTYEVSFSDDGSRVLMDSYEVRDRSFGLVGRLGTGIETGWSILHSILSPDGRRVYALALADNVPADGPTTLLPRIYVYDSSTSDPVTSQLPVVGMFELQHFPSCRRYDYVLCPLTRPRMTTAPDGHTLFLAGNQHLVVAPVPAELRTVGSAAARRAQAQRRAPVVQAWPAAAGALKR